MSCSKISKKIVAYYKYIVIILIPKFTLMMWMNFVDEDFREE